MLKTVLAATLAFVPLFSHAGNEQYAGGYQLGQDFRITVSADHGRLYMQAALHPCAAMAAEARRQHCPFAPGRLFPMPWAQLQETGIGQFKLEQVNLGFRFDGTALTVVQDPQHVVFALPSGPTLHLQRSASAAAVEFQPTGGAAPAEALAPYPAVYTEGGQFDLKISAGHGYLRAQPMNGPSLLLYPDGKDRFVTLFPAMAAQFERDAGGNINQLRWFMEGTDHLLTRQPADYVAKLPPSPFGKTCKASAPSAANLERGRFLADESIASSALGESVPICLFLPPGYADSKRSYPVIYATDGEYIESLAAFLERRHIPAVVVGLGGFDLREINLLLPGAERYFRFIVDEAIPYIEARYRIDGKQRILAGHSLGGAFVATAALLDDPTRPRFANFLSSDGSFWATPTAFNHLIEKRLHAGRRLSAHLVLAGAGYGNGQDVRRSYERLREAGFESLRLDFLDLPDENHGTVAQIAFERSLTGMLPHEAPPLGNVAIRADGVTQALTYEGAGTYAGRLRLTRGQHALLLESAQGSFGGVTATMDGHAVAMLASHQPLRVDAERTGLYAARVVAGEQPMLALAPVLSRFEAEPFYLRGSMNNWGTQTIFRRIGESRYRAELELAQGTHELKVGSEDFQSIDYGAAPAQQELGTAPAALQAGGANLILKLDAPAKVSFDLDVGAEDAPRLTVARAPR